MGPRGRKGRAVGQMGSPSRTWRAFKRGWWGESAEGTWLDLTIPALTFYSLWPQGRRGPDAGEHLHVRDERKGACERGRKGAEKSEENQYDSARQLRGAMSLGQMGLHLGPQFLAMWIDTLLPTLPLSPPVWKVDR